MILKEAFRMQNHLRELIDEAYVFLSVKDNVTKVKEEHLRKRSNPAAENETIEVTRETDMKADMVIDIYLDLIKEKEKLSKAISKAKAGAGMDIDSTLEINKTRQEAITRIGCIAALKSSENDREGQDYLINAEGNQTPYVYTIHSVRTIDFDREKVKGILNRLRHEADEMSARIDLLNVTLEVDYTPKYEIGDTFEDAYEKYTA